MSKLQNTYSVNAENIFMRTLYAVISEFLNDKISYYQVESNTVKKKLDVPIVLSMTGQQRFLQYYFLDRKYEVCENILEGSYDIVPRGVLSFEEGSLLTNKNTSPYAQCVVNDIDKNGNITYATASINSIPLSLPFKLDILCNSESEQFKIQQSVLRTLYYSNRLSFMFEGIHIPVMISWQDNSSREKTRDFQTGSANSKNIVSFNLDIETYMPSLRNISPIGNIIKKFETNYSTNPEETFREELQETQYTGKLSGNISLNDLPLDNIKLYLKNDFFEYEQEATFEGGSFLFTSVPEKAGYYIIDENDNVYQRRIIIKRNDNVRLKLSIYSEE